MSIYSFVEILNGLDCSSHAVLHYKIRHGIYGSAMSKCPPAKHNILDTTGWIFLHKTSMMCFISVSCHFQKWHGLPKLGTTAFYCVCVLNSILDANEWCLPLLSLFPWYCWYCNHEQGRELCSASM